MLTPHTRREHEVVSHLSRRGVRALGLDELLSVARSQSCADAVLNSRVVAPRSEHVLVVAALPSHGRHSTCPMFFFCAVVTSIVDVCSNLCSLLVGGVVLSRHAVSLSGAIATCFWSDAFLRRNIVASCPEHGGDCACSLELCLNARPFTCAQELQGAERELLASTKSSHGPPSGSHGPPSYNPKHGYCTPRKWSLCLWSERRRHFF